MKSLLRNSLVSTIFGYLIWGYMVICARTIRWQIEGEEAFRNAWKEDQGLLVAAWHSRILLLPTIWSRIARELPGKAFPTAMLISLSRDGDAITKTLRHLGLDAIRGSSTHKRKKKDKGGIAALTEITRRLRAGSVVCITPDGPRGPAEVAQSGPVLLAQRSGAALIPYALECRPVWRLKTWDRFMIPIPFSKGAMVIGEPLALDASLTASEGQQRLAQALETAYARAAQLLSGKS